MIYQFEFIIYLLFLRLITESRMDETGLEYPDEDLDRMLDDEMEVNYLTRNTFNKTSKRVFIKTIDTCAFNYITL